MDNTLPNIHYYKAGRLVFVKNALAKEPASEDDYDTRHEEYNTERGKHRTDGPAIVTFNNKNVMIKQEWYINGKLHRIDGPAYIGYYQSGKIWIAEWFLYGKKIQPEYTEWPLTKEQQIEMKLQYG